MSSRASPPVDETVQMSPPETNAISRWSGEIEGSDSAGRDVAEARRWDFSGNSDAAVSANRADARDANENVTDNSKEGSEREKAGG